MSSLDGLAPGAESNVQFSPKSDRVIMISGKAIKVTNLSDQRTFAELKKSDVSRM